ncbi:hypothetical protein [Pseudoduganella sp.]|uniref:hypothetical protein n=1 Tax=Pseudoduganella sp. TaxID=1880898 RepID=UPI0035B141FF
MTRFKALLLAALIALPPGASAYTAIATIDGYASQSWHRASNYATQKEADKEALRGCREDAQKSGIGKLARQCKIVTRAKMPGYGALVCGDNGCSWSTGYDSRQAAVDSAYAACAKSYTNCPENNIQNWEDFAGFGKKAADVSAPAGADCRPRTSVVNCRSACTNGNCLIQYENGCKIRVQVQGRFNPFNNQWEYPAPQC